MNWVTKRETFHPRPEQVELLSNVASPTGNQLMTAEQVEAVAASSQSRRVLTAPVSVSGTSVTITGIPEWAVKITIIFNKVRMSTVGYVDMQVGKGSGEITGYYGGAAFLDRYELTYAAQFGTTYFALKNPVSSHANVDASGTLVMYRHSDKEWVMAGCWADNSVSMLAGSKSLINAMDMLTIYVGQAGPTFVSGAISMLYEA